MSTKPFDVRDYVNGSGTADAVPSGNEKKPFDVRDYINNEAETQTPGLPAPVSAYPAATTGLELPAPKVSQPQHTVPGLPAPKVETKPGNGYVSVADLNRADRASAAELAGKQQAQTPTLPTTTEEPARTREDVSKNIDALNQERQQLTWESGTMGILDPDDPQFAAKMQRAQEITARINEIGQELEQLENEDEVLRRQEPGYGQNIFQRAGGGVKGGALQFAAGNVDAARVGGQLEVAGASAQLYTQYLQAAERAKKAYEKEVQKHGENTEKAVRLKKEWEDNLEVSKTFLNSFETVEDNEVFKGMEETADKLQEQSQEAIDHAKSGATKVGKLGVDLVAQGVQMVPDAVASAVVPGSGLALMGVRSFGSGAQKARQAGANLAQQMGYGAATAAVEVLTEKMFDGIAGIYGEGFADGVVEGIVEKVAKGKLGPKAVELISGMSEEAIEELVAGIVDPMLENIYDPREFGERYKDPNTYAEMGYSALIGGLMGGIGTGGQIVANTVLGRASGGANVDATEQKADGAEPGGAAAEVKGLPSTAEELAEWRGETKTAPVAYTEAEANYIRRDAKTFRNVVAGADISVRDFFSKWRDGRKSHLGEKLEKLYLGKLSDTSLDRVSEILGYDVDSRDVIVTNDDIKHIYDDHPELPDWAVSALQDTVLNPDSIDEGHEGNSLRNKDKTGVVFSKVQPDGTVVCIQFDNSGRGTMEVTTVYVKENSRLRLPDGVSPVDGSSPLRPERTGPVPSTVETTIPQTGRNSQVEDPGDVRLLPTAEEYAAWRDAEPEAMDYRPLPTAEELQAEMERERWREDALADADAAQARAEAQSAEDTYTAAERAGKKAEMRETDKMTGVSKSAAALKKSLMDSFGIRWSDRYDGDYSVSKVVDSFVEDVQRDGRLTRSRAEQLFDALYERGTVFQEADSYLKEIRNGIKGAKIYVSEDVRAEFGDDWADFRRRAGMNGIQLSTSEGRGIDSYTHEFAQIFGGQFDDGADLKSQLEYLVDCAERGRGTLLTQKQMTEILRGQYGDAAVQEYLNGLEQNITQAFDRFAASAGVESELRGQQAEMAKRQAERRALRELQSKTLKQLQWLSKNRHQAPADLRAQFDDVLGNIDTLAISAANEMNYSKKYGATWRDLADMYKAAQKEDPNFLPSKELEKIVMRLDGDKIADLDIDALQDLYRAAMGLRTEYYNRNNIINDELGRTFADAYQASKEEIAEAKGPGKVGEKFFNTKMLTPMNALMRMAGWDRNSTFYSFAKQLETGERDYKNYKVQAEKSLKGFIEENAEWVKTADGQGKDAVWYEIEVPELLELRMGDKPIFSDKTVTVYMTPAQKVFMALEAENYDNLRHMAGGRTFADKGLYSKGKRAEAFAAGTTVKLAPETVKKIVSDLTPQEVALKKAMSEYYNTFSKGEINRVSNAVWGYDRAMSNKYAPIFTNQNYVGKQAGIFDSTAEGVGHLKARQYSKNPSLNISAFDAFERHTDQTARFVGFTIPIRNFERLLNWQGDGTSMRDVISHKWGAENGTTYIDDLLADVQTSRFSETGTVEKATNALLSNYITSVFGANPGIVFKQAASFPQAAAVLGHRTAPSIRQMRSVDAKLIGKYTPELDYRLLGYSTPETATLKNNPGVLDSNKVTKFLFRGGAITAMDGVTVKCLWPWAENYVAKNYPNLSKGSQADIDAGNSPYYRKVAEVFNEAVVLTQPMYDEMHRAGIMKESGAITRAFTMFKTVPVQQYNTLRQAFGEYQFAKQSGKEVAAASKKVGNAVTATLLSTAMLESIELLNNLWKNGGKSYRDDKDKLTAGSVATEFAKKSLSDLAGMVIGGSEIADMISSLVSGGKWYGIEIPGGEQLNELVDKLKAAGEGIYQVVNDGIDLLQNGGDLDEYFRVHAGDIRGGIKDIAGTAAMYIGGLPAANVEKYLMGTLRIAAPEFYTKMEDSFETPGKENLKGLSGARLEARVSDILTLRMERVAPGAIREMVRMYELYGGECMPPDAPTSVEIKDEKVELSATQQQKYSEAYAVVLRQAVNRLGTDMTYQGLEDDEKLKYVKKSYIVAREWARGQSIAGYESDDLKKINDLMDDGMSLAQIAEVMSLKSAMPAAEFSAWLEDNLSGQFQTAAKDVLNFSTSNYDKFKAMGMTDERIFEVTELLAQLEPEEGNKAVTRYQEYRAIEHSKMPVGDISRAMKAVMSESAYEGYKAAKTHKLTDEYFTALEIESSTEGDKGRDGKAITGSKTLKVMQELDKLALRDQQKIWLFQALGHTGENMWESAYKGDDYETYYFMTESGKRNYDHYCAWMDVAEFRQHYEKVGSFSADAKGTKKEKAIAYIDGLDLINDKKSALYVACGYKSTTLKDCPWYNEHHFQTQYFPVD